ncbi:MAG: hypothetical protein JO256_07370 [Alphaproteobacteria bacterium]|nr:hypothetical protein [Alphaproteobacteria bacterium]
MDIHKPKPIHNWRELLTEIGVIVVGVAIALSAEQGVEWLHNRAKAAEARAGIREEIAENLAYMQRRDATEACIARRLDEVQGLIVAAAAGKLPQDALWIGIPVGAVINAGKYKAAVQSGAVSLFDDKEQAIYSNIYTAFDVYITSYMNEFDDWANLRTLEAHPPASPVLDWQLRSALGLARQHRWAVQATRLVALRTAAEVGLAPGHWQKVRMSETCVPLHTSREAAVKMTFAPEWGLAPP